MSFIPLAVLAVVAALVVIAVLVFAKN